MDSAARAIAEPTRRAILQIVRDEERTVSEIAAQFDVSRPAISQHLRVLAEADLVTVRHEGTRRLYRAHPDGMAELTDWMNSFWTSSLKTRAVEAERQQWNAKKDEVRARREQRPKPGTTPR